MADAPPAAPAATPPPATPPPAAPPATPPATPPPAEAPKNDKVLANIYKTFGLAVDDEFRLTPLPEAERLKDMDRAEAPAAPATPPVTPPPATPPATPPVTAPPATPPALEVKKPATEEILDFQRKVQADLARFDKRLDELPKPTPPPATPPPAPPANPDASFEAGLPEENRETIELLRWAEQNNQAEFKGSAGNYVAYLKRLDEFTRSNPEEDAVAEFQKQNRPSISETAVRKLSREKIKSEAKAEAREEARKELSPELDSLRRKQYELEIKPVLADASREFRLRFADEAGKLPEGVERIDVTAAKEVMQGGEEAAKKHKIIAPILKFHAALADEYMDLSLGMKDYDPGNQMHRFLDQFIFHQEQVLLKAPPDRQIRSGKQFMATVKYQEAHAKDAAGTEAKYWMFSNDDVRRMIEINAHKQAGERRKEIAEAARSMGFAEPTAPPATTPPPTPPPASPPAPPDPPSPRTTGGRMPGAATTPATATQLQQAAGTVYPKELLETVK